MYKNKNVNHNFLYAAISCCALSSPIALAQLEEVIVTAQKREQSLQDVPISVSAVSGRELAEQNRNEVFDLSKMVPGFTFKSGTSDTDKSIQVRGVGTSSFSQGIEQTVGTMIDGVVTSAQAASFLDFDDVERVEVLRGPQGMLFGKNASAGLLNITTKRPDAEFNAGLAASFADENEIKTSGYISGPLVDDSVLGRLSYYSNTRDPIIENVFPGGQDFNDRDEWGAKVKLLFTPSDNVEIYLNASHSERDSICCVQPTASTLIPGIPSGAENDQTIDPNTATGATEVDVFSAEINYQLGDYTITSVTSFTDSESSNSVLAFGLPIMFARNNDSFSDVSQFTQELRITSPAYQKITYQAGLYFYKNELDRDFFRVLDLGTAFQSTSNTANVESESASAFGQATWHINEETRLTLGLRYNSEDISLKQTIAAEPLPASVENPSGAPVFPEAALGTINTSKTDSAVSWRIIAERDLSDTNMAYATISRGYKGPGANTLFSGVSATDPIIDAEIPTNFELGLKSEWADGKVRFNAAIFRTEFEDFQASLSDGNIPANFFLDNAGQLTTEGVEIEVAFQATDNLFLSGNLASIDAAFDEYVGAACYPGQTAAQGCVDNAQDLSGKDLPFSPDLAVNLLARYDIPLENLPFDMYVQGSYHWQDEVQFQTNNDPRSIADAYGTADFSLGLNSKDGRYSAQIFVKNAFDEFYVSNLSTAVAALGLELTQGLEYDYTRRAGISLKVNF